MIDVSSFDGVPVPVLGLGRSGIAAAHALARGGASVWAWDDNSSARTAAAGEGINIVDLDKIDWQQTKSLVLSPGIAHTHPVPNPLVARARAAGCEIIGEVELLGRTQSAARYLGITGTNGKSTTTELIGHIFQVAGVTAEVGGNLGTPACALAPLESDGTYILEMSSYQLELTFSIAFDVAVLLNITPDHLERHGGMAGYIAAKRLIFERQSAPNTAIIGVDDDICRRIHADLVDADEQAVVAISAYEQVHGGVYVEDGRLVDDTDHQNIAVMELSSVASLRGAHNWQNAAAAFAACKMAGLDVQTIAAGIASYPGLVHRQEPVGLVDGVLFVNDSKATNGEAAARALSCFENVFWICGGEPKEGGLAACASSYAGVRHAYLIGDATDQFAAELAGVIPITCSGDLATATAQAFAAAKESALPGAVVLLSPACASFDQFDDFEARGDAFRSIVMALPGMHKPALQMPSEQSLQRGAG